MPEVTAELRDWMYDTGGMGVFHGEIYGDTKERWPDGRHIRTSSVEEIVENDDHYIVYTLNSVYLLMKSHKRLPPGTSPTP